MPNIQFVGGGYCFVEKNISGMYLLCMQKTPTFVPRIQQKAVRF